MSKSKSFFPSPPQRRRGKSGDNSLRFMKSDLQFSEFGLQSRWRTLAAVSKHAPTPRSPALRFLLHRPELLFFFILLVILNTPVLFGSGCQSLRFQSDAVRNGQ